MGFRFSDLRFRVSEKSTGICIRRTWFLSNLRRSIRKEARLNHESLLGGSWDLVTRVIIKVTILITIYNPT